MGQMRGDESELEDVYSDDDDDDGDDDEWETRGRKRTRSEDKDEDEWWELPSFGPPSRGRS